MDTNQQVERAECDFCEFEFPYAALRTCYECCSCFCLMCAPRLGVAVLQCCNYHGLVLWFCSEVCRTGHTSETVREMNVHQEPCCD